MLVRTFGWSMVITVIGLAFAGLIWGWSGLAVVAILSVLEISLSFDNAVINAGILRKLNTQACCPKDWPVSATLWPQKGRTAQIEISLSDAAAELLFDQNLALGCPIFPKNSRAPIPSAALGGFSESLHARDSLVSRRILSDRSSAGGT